MSTENMPVKHLSHSSRSLLADCGKKWEFKYVHQIPEDVALAMKVGSANHTVLEGVNRWIKDQKTAPDKTYFRKMADDVARLSLPPEAFKDVKPRSNADKAMSPDAFMAHSQELVIRQLQDMSSIYIDKAGIEFKEVLCVEEGLTVDIEGIPYNMYLDVLVMTKAGAVKVIDFKTKGQSGGEPDIMQLTGYSFAPPVLVKREVQGLEQWDFIKKADPDLEIHALDMRRLPEYLQVFKEELRGGWDTVKTRKFLRNFRSPFCGPEKCGYWASCTNPAEFAQRRATTADFHKDLVEGLEHRRTG